MNTSDIGSTFVAKDALDESGIDPESLDQIIVAHNFETMSLNTRTNQTWFPSLASRIKHNL